MLISTIKKYIKSFVCEGISLKNAFRMSYCTSEDIEKISKDKKFLSEIDKILLQLSLDRVRGYNTKVDESSAPSDHLKRLSNVMEVIDKDHDDTIRDIKVTIVKQRGPDAD